MPATMIETVNVPWDTAVELLAIIDAAADATREVLGPNHPLVEFFEERRNEDLTKAVLGPYSTGKDDPWQSDRHVVDIHARAAEIQADALERCSFSGLVPRLRREAVEYRERGTIAIA